MNREKYFLFRKKDSDDRDCCAYIEEPGFECDHYFAHVNLQGANYCGGEFPAYHDIETVLTRAEYAKLIKYNQKISDLGYGIRKGDGRYRRGMELLDELVYPVLEKLASPEGVAFFEKIQESEKEYVMDKYDLSEEEVERIFREYPSEYRDRGIVGCVYDDMEELGRAGVDNYTEFGRTDRDSGILERYFDFEGFGRELFSDGIYTELEDGRILEYSE